MSHVETEVKKLSSNSSFKTWYDKHFVSYVQKKKNSKSLSEMILDIEAFIKDQSISGAPILKNLIRNYPN